MYTYKCDVKFNCSVRDGEWDLDRFSLFHLEAQITPPDANYLVNVLDYCSAIRCVEWILDIIYITHISTNNC